MPSLQMQNLYDPNSSKGEEDLSILLSNKKREEPNTLAQLQMAGIYLSSRGNNGDYSAGNS